MELEGLRLQSLVRSLRTTDCKRTPSNSAMCAFAPPEKMARFNVGKVDNVDMICGMSGQLVVSAVVSEQAVSGQRAVRGRSVNGQ